MEAVKGPGPREFPSIDTSHMEVLRLLDEARAMLRFAHAQLERIGALVPCSGDYQTIARVLGTATGRATGTRIAISAHMRYIQGDPIESDEGGGENVGS